MEYVAFVKQNLSEPSDLGPLSYFAGIGATSTDDGYSLSVDVRDLIAHSGPRDIQTTATPMDFIFSFVPPTTFHLRILFAIVILLPVLSILLLLGWILLMLSICTATLSVLPR